MQIKNYLEKYQPVIFHTFKNALNNQTLSHAYLIVGEVGTNLIDTAKFLAKSILCNDGDPFACDSCINCMRVDSDNYPDLMIFNGEKSIIKKEDVTFIESQFEKTALDDKGIKIYILHLVENMTLEAVNSVLKFLEEPESNIYAILTSNNENAVLPTIISRCQVMHLKPIKREIIIEEAIEEGITREDAELLSYFYNDINLMKSALEKDKIKEYTNAKEALIKFLNAIEKDEKEAIYIEEKEIQPLVKNKESMRFFLDLLINFFEQILLKQNNREVLLKSYDEIITTLNNKLENIDNSLIELMKGRSLLNLNINSSLLLDHLTLTILKKEENNQYDFE
ncbi:MAG: hypothetical protein ACI31G_04915 [Bacilli bacterium]